MIELRWLKRIKTVQVRQMPNISDCQQEIEEKVLQYRQRLWEQEDIVGLGGHREGYGKWSEWKDVPVVSDVPTERG